MAYNGMPYRGLTHCAVAWSCIVIVWCALPWLGMACSGTVVMWLVVAVDGSVVVGLDAVLGVAGWLGGCQIGCGRLRGC